MVLVCGLIEKLYTYMFIATLRRTGHRFEREWCGTQARSEGAKGEKEVM